MVLLGDAELGCLLVANHVLEDESSFRTVKDGAQLVTNGAIRKVASRG